MAHKKKKEEGNNENIKETTEENTKENNEVTEEKKEIGKKEIGKKEKKKSPKKSEDIDLSKVAGAIGGETLDMMESVKYWVDTGNLALNYACSGKFFGGGIPIGKIIEVWGNSSSCKTLFALNFLRGIQRLNGIAVFLDVENTLNATFAETAAHIDTKNVIVIPIEKVDSLEKAFNQIHVVLREITKVYGKERPIVIVYDSIAASATEREFAETTIDMFKSSKEQKKEAGAGADKPAEHAKIISKELRKLNPVLNRDNASVVIINQVREKIGILFGQKEKPASGGRGLAYYCSLSLRTNAHSRLKDERENVKGILVTVDNTKNKCYRPFIKSPEKAELLFDVGINPLGGLLLCLYKAYRIDKDGGSWKVRPEYSNGEEVTFRASKEKNVVPLDVLVKCPKLVDAESSERVIEYFNSFGEAVNTNTQYTEENISDDEDSAG